MEKVSNFIKIFFKRLLILLVLVGLGAGFVFFYPYIFSVKIKGIVVGVNHIPINVAVISGGSGQQNVSPQVFSFSVAIQDPKSSEILTASSEDRQWAVVKPNQCAVAEFFPYPPWNLKKQGTYMNARLIQLFETCE